MQSKHFQATVRKSRSPLVSFAQIVPLLLLLAVVTVVIWLWQRLQNPASYPIQHIKVVATASHVPVVALQKLVRGHLQGGFFSLNTAAVKSGVMESPWVKSVSLRRVWPNTLVVAVKEHMPLAQWGAASLLAQDGTVFAVKKETLPSDLPLVEGPMQAKDQIMQNLQLFEKALGALNQSIQTVTVSSRLAWHLTLTNGMQVNLCRDQVVQHFQDFLAVYPKLLAPHSQDVLSVDLCYPNGLAVRWRGGKAPVHT